VPTVAAVGFSSGLQRGSCAGRQEKTLQPHRSGQGLDALLAGPDGLGAAVRHGPGRQVVGGSADDKSWLAVYQEQGVTGVGLVAAIFIVLGGVAFPLFRCRGPAGRSS